jgi:signal transduction histidine kinase
MNKIAYRWIFIFTVLILAVDFFFELFNSSEPFWKTDWFWWRVLLILLIIIFFLIYFSSIYYKKSEIEKYNFIKKLVEQNDSGYRKIASDIHDGLGQNLIVLNNEIIKLTNSITDDPELKNKLNNLGDLVSESINETRNISSRLHPHHIEKLGLKKALETMLNTAFNSTDINCDITIDNIDRLLDISSEISFYRVVQECVNNIIKHSEAKEAVVNIKFSVGEIIADIKDNGKGFQPDEFSGKIFTGFGLSNIKHRLMLAGGRFDIDAKPGKGTKIKIYFPIKN